MTYQENKKLLINWKSPEKKENFAVGTLIKLENGYNFFYNKEIVKEASLQGFVPFVGLRDINKNYESDKLFSVFERRIPNVDRKDFQNFLAKYDELKSKDVLWMYLSLDGAKLATDSLSFVLPFLYEKSNNMLYLACYIAGFFRYNSKNHDYDESSSLFLELEKNNPYDINALMILDEKKQRLGYIPKPFNFLLTRFLKKSNKNYTIHTKFFHIFKNKNINPEVIVSLNIPQEELKKEKDLQYMIEYR